MANKNFDECASFLIDNGLFVGRICRLENVLKTIIAKHGYVKNVSAALSESTALAVLLANALKFDGLFTLQLQGNGPVSTIVVDVTSGGTMRACANYDKDRLQKAMEELTRNKTIIMIAHRLKTVRNADQILVVNNGNIVQQGKHSELIKQKGIYADFILGREEAIGWKLKSVPSANDKKTS